MENHETKSKVETIKRVNKEIFSQELIDRKMEMYNLLAYVARNIDKPKSIEIKLERFFNELSDECHKKNDFRRYEQQAKYRKNGTKRTA